MRPAHEQVDPYPREAKGADRNAPCACGSQRKAKKCCKDQKVAELKGKLWPMRLPG